MCEESFGTAVARAVAPYTPLPASELLRAADAAGRGVAFDVDDLSKAPQRVRRALVSGAQTARLRTPTHGIIITAQSAPETAALPDLIDIELQVPQADERLAVLDTYGHADIIERCELFTTPLELALAADCATDLPAETTSANCSTSTSTGRSTATSASAARARPAPARGADPLTAQAGRQPHATARA